MQRVYETCVPRDEVLSGELTDDMFAAKLGKVVEGEAPDIYQDPGIFLSRTYPTEGLKSLVQAVMSRVTNPESTEAPIIRLETSFGGGKTHGLIALYHLARNCGAIGEVPGLVDASLIPDEEIPFATVVGTELDPTNGIPHGDIRTYTMWGEIAYQLAGPEGYAIMEKSDQEGTRPGGAVWEELLDGRPAIICIDEIANFMRAFGRQHASTEQTAAFLHTLFGVASSTPQVSVIWTLAEAGDAFAKESERLVAQLSELQTVGAREEVVLTPTGDTEYAPVINHRLFDEIDEDAGEDMADEYVRFYDQNVNRGVALTDEATAAEYRAELERAYPFHPETIHILSLKTAAIANFQRTRGMLRLLAHVIRNVWANEAEDAYFLQPYDIDVSVEEIRDEVTSRLDRGAYNTVIEADIFQKGGHSHAQEIDAELGGDDKPPVARRVANTILLHSITTSQARGATEAEINVGCGVPGLDYDYVDRALEALHRDCWYIDPDRTKYRFQTDPQINKIIYEETENVDRHAAKQELLDRIRSIYSGNFFETVFFAEEPGDVADDAKKPKLVVLDFDSETAKTSDEELPSLVKTVYERTGTQGKYRTYQNNVLFVVADRDQRETMINVARKYVALSHLTNPTRLAEYEEPQQNVIKDRKADAELDLRVAITRAYRHLLYPGQGEGLLQHHTIEVQDSARADRDQEQVLIELLHQLDVVQLADDEPMSPVYAKEKVWRNDEQELSTAEYARRFAINRGLRIVMTPDQFKRTIKKGAADGVWVYYDSPAEKAYFEDAPPGVVIDEDHMLYTEERANELDLLGEEEPPEGGKGGEGPDICPLCGKPRDECTCGTAGGEGGATKQLVTEGTPNKAFTDLRDLCEAEDIERLSALNLTVDKAQELRVLGLALPQLVELQMNVAVTEGRFLAEFDDGSVKMDFNGPWDRIKEVRDFVEDFDARAKDSDVKIVTQMNFENPVEPAGQELERMQESLDQLEIGNIGLEGLPAAEDGDSDGE